MSEIRDILGKALPEKPPPISIDRDSVISAGRRARTRRNWAVSASAAAGVLVVAAGVAGGLSWAAGTRTGLPSEVGAQSPTSSNLAASPTPTTAPTPSSSPSLTATPSIPPGTPGAYRSDNARDMNVPLTQALRNAVAEVAPTLALEVAKNAWAGQDLNPFEVVGSQAGYKVFAELRDSEGVGYFFAYLSKEDAAAAREQVLAGCGESTPGMACSTESFPTGEAVLIRQGKPNGLRKTVYMVTVAKPNGTLIDAMVENYSHNDQPRAGNPNPQRPTPPLTVEQLTTILLKPGVTLAN